MYTQVWDSLLRARAGELRPSVVTQSGPLGFFLCLQPKNVFCIIAMIEKNQSSNILWLL